jgi:CBS domain-containing protein
MVNDVVTIDAGGSLVDAAQLMRDANVGVLPVMEGSRIGGILTDRDLVVRAMTSDVLPSTAQVGEFASREVVSAHPDWTLDQAMATMAQAQIGRLPVMDDNDHIVGMVTLSSLALRSNEQHETLEAAQEVSRRSARV